MVKHTQTISRQFADGRGKEGDLIWKSAKILWEQNFFLHLWEDQPLWGALKLYGEVIFVTALSLFHLFRNSYNPEK